MTGYAQSAKLGCGALPSITDAKGGCPVHGMHYRVNWKIYHDCFSWILCFKSFKVVVESHVHCYHDSSCIIRAPYGGTVWWPLYNGPSAAVHGLWQAMAIYQHVDSSITLQLHSILTTWHSSILRAPQYLFQSRFTVAWSIDWWSWNIYQDYYANTTWWMVTCRPSKTLWRLEFPHCNGYNSMSYLSGWILLAVIVTLAVADAMRRENSEHLHQLHRTWKYQLACEIIQVQYLERSHGTSQCSRAAIA